MVYKCVYLYQYKTYLFEIRYENIQIYWNDLAGHDVVCGL
jgi:hypothetical protein